MNSHVGSHGVSRFHEFLTNFALQYLLVQFRLHGMIFLQVFIAVVPGTKNHVTELTPKFFTLELFGMNFLMFPQFKVERELFSTLVTYFCLVVAIHMTPKDTGIADFLPTFWARRTVIIFSKMLRNIVGNFAFNARV